MPEVSVLLADATKRLAAAGVASPRVDAEFLLADALGLGRGALAARTQVSQPVADDFEQRLARRARREPLQHILGTAAFRHVEVAVGPGVFVPRPETELLVDAVLADLTSTSGPTAVDLCSGSGALALAIADEVPGARVVAVENDHAALGWLRRNAAGTPIEIIGGDVGDPTLLSALHGRVDVVVCNPPYVPDRTPVEPEVRADPPGAVFAGVAGLDLMSTVIRAAGQLLRSGGVLALEHDETHAGAVLDLVRSSGWWTETTGHVDLAGRDRYVTTRRRS